MMQDNKNSSGSKSDNQSRAEANNGVYAVKTIEEEDDDENEQY